MIKTVLFDLDGVLCDTKWIHYDALNKALGEYSISEEEHLRIYNGMKTRRKLQLLSETKNLPISDHQRIYDEKQIHTIEQYKTRINPNEDLTKLLDELTERGYTLGCCTNSNYELMTTALDQLNITNYFSIKISGDQVKNNKPHPETYWMAMTVLNALPEQTVIIEDSPNGLLAAKRSCPNVIRVSCPSEVTCENILPRITGENFMTKWKDDNLTVLIPMAGEGSRFADAGYTFPKPLINVNGKPMIQLVVEKMGIDANFVFVVRKEHREKYNLDMVLNLIIDGCTIVDVDHLTEGAACTALLAKQHIDNDKPLLFVNSDQYIEWNPTEFMYTMQESNADGGIVTFKDTHPKWSFAKVDPNTNLVTEVAEKKPISDNATAGYYYWKSGSDFVKYAEQMIERNIRVNNEFYVAPVYNQAIEDNKKIRIYECQKMWGLGTPEDLNYYLLNNKD